MNSITKKLFPFILCVLCVFSIQNSWALKEELNSIFWQITDLEGKKHYLFGTIHTDDNRVSNLQINTPG